MHLCTQTHPFSASPFIDRDIKGGEIGHARAGPWYLWGSGQADHTFRKCLEGYYSPKVDFRGSGYGSGGLGGMNRVSGEL